jgi:diacylglycerol O-acyltransferase
VWHEDPAFDLDAHIRRERVEAPGDHAALDRTVSRIASVPLARDRPLWEVTFLDGLADGKIAFVAKVHHALADGIASAALLANVLAPEAEIEAPPERETEALPSSASLLGNALLEQPRRVREFFPLVRRTVSGGLDVVRRFDLGTSVATRPFQAPRTRFDRPLTSERTFASATLPFEPFQTAKKTLGVTLNDVVLSVVGGALRRYLAGLDEPPPSSLVAAVPMALGDAAPRRLGGNLLSNVFVSLCSDVADPIARAKEIHERADATKETMRAFGPTILREWAEYAPSLPFTLGFRAYSDLALSRFHRPAANAIVSNVRGPGSVLKVAGSELVALWSVGPILDGLGLNVTAWSYAGKMCFAVLGSPPAVPDTRPIADALGDSLRELSDALATPKRA